MSESMAGVLPEGDNCDETTNHYTQFSRLNCPLRFPQFVCIVILMTRISSFQRLIPAVIIATISDIGTAHKARETFEPLSLQQP